MCGITGVFFPRSVTPTDTKLEAMMSVMTHRGPDGDGRYRSRDGRFLAGFRRLAIIDLEASDQPILDADDRYVLLGNGEIYNYVELRQRADTKDYPYKSRGDMEVILPLIQSLGEDFVDHLNGIFALALYDSQNHSLTLIRDRVGVKPLYWATLKDGSLIFGSEIKALFASGLITPEIDDDDVSAYLAHGYVPSPRTIFKGVRKLPPGHRLKIVADGKIDITPYWDLTGDEDLPTEPAEIEQHLLDLLSDSVRLQLRSDVPIGILLSGGIDSGLLVALAAAHSGSELNTYTVRFEGGGFDESPLAEEVARRYGTNHTTLDLPSGAIHEQLARLAWMTEEPLNDPAVLPNYLIEQALSERVTVALNGTGGDELFAGYGRYFPLEIEKKYLALPRWTRANIVEPAAGLVSPMTAWQLSRAGKFESDRGGYLHDHSTHFPAPVRGVIGNQQSCPDPAQRVAFEKFVGPAQSGALYADIKTYLPEDLLTLVDKTSMAVSVEARVPFLDHRFMAAALSVPPEIRTPNGAQKGLERRMASRYLPESVLTAPKQGFVSPVPNWIKSGLGETARRLLTRPKTLERGWWTAAGIDKLLAKPDQHGYRLYSLLMLEMIVRVHVEARMLDAPDCGLEAFL